MLYPNVMRAPLKNDQNNGQLSNSLANSSADSLADSGVEAELESLKPTDRADFSEVALNRKADLLAQAFQGRLPSQSELKNITEELGVEIATAVFARAAHESNVHGAFAREVRSFDFLKWNRSSANAVEVTIVASSFFQSGRRWGDHIEKWRAWARELGFTTDVIETDPRRSIAANARYIFEHLARSPGRQRIIVTYGQGATELRYLLHRRVNRDPTELIPEELENIRGWLSVCGGFGGASSSRFLQEHRLSRLLFRLRMKVAGRNPIALAETSTAFPLWKKQLPMIPGMNIVSLIGLPYRWHLGKGLSTFYDAIGKTLPNDGVVSVYEAAAYPGLLVPVLGMDHRAQDEKLEPHFKRVLATMAHSIGVGRIPELELDRGPKPGPTQK